MTAAVVAALDFGSSGLKAALITADGTTLATAQHSYPTCTRSGGVVEQDPQLWWEAVSAVVPGLLAQADGVRPSAVSLTGQMQDLVLLDAAGHAVRHALLYSDLRAGEQYARLAAKFPDWNARTANAQDASSVAAKINWLADHEPEALDRTAVVAFGPSAAIAYRAGGIAACDLVTASTSGLLDVGRGQWAADICAATGLPAAALPTLLTSPDPAASVVGELSAGAARQWGLDAGTPLVMAAGDAGSTTDGLVGSAVGSGYLYLGTTGWVARVVPRERIVDHDYLYSLFLPGLESAVAIGAVLSAGSAADWARRTFLDDHDFLRSDRAVLDRFERVGPERLLCLPGIGGERAPVRNPDLRGTFVGATEATEPIDFYRAVLTGVAMNLRHVADDTGSLPDRLPVVGGAAASAAWRQILADVFGRPVVRIRAAEPGAHSAARQAALALNWPTVPAPLAESVHPTEADIVAPSPHAETYADLLPLHRRLYDTLAPAFRALRQAQGTADTTQAVRQAQGTADTTQQER